VTTPIVWISEQLEDGRVGFRIGRCGNELVAEFVGLGILRADPAGASFSFEPDPGAHPETVEKLRQGLVPALLRHLRRELTLHGASVALEGRAVACVGLSGAGKSTLAARLCTERDAAFLADDTTAIDLADDAPCVLPTERVHWLVSARAAPDPKGDTKFAVSPRALASAPTPLAMICRVRFDETLAAPSVTRLRGHDALQALVPTVIRFAIDDREAHLWELEQLEKVVRSVPVYDLARPRGDDASLARALECLIELVHRSVRSEL
jgi:hypothetical protein